MGVAEGRSKVDGLQGAAARVRLIACAFVLSALGSAGNLVASEDVDGHAGWRLVAISGSAGRSVFASPDSNLIVLQAGDQLPDGAWQIHIIDSAGVVLAPTRIARGHVQVVLRSGDRVPDPSEIPTASTSADQVYSALEVADARALEQARGARK